MLVKYNVTSIRKLNDLRRHHKELPSRYVYERLFGSLRNAVDIAFGKITKPKHTSEYLLKIFRGFRVYRYSEFLRLHDEMPDIIPHPRMVEKRFGSFVCGSELAKKGDAEFLIGELVKYCEKNEFPRKGQFEEVGLPPYVYYREHFDTIGELRELVLMLVKVKCENRR